MSKKSLTGLFEKLNKKGEKVGKRDQKKDPGYWQESLMPISDKEGLEGKPFIGSMEPDYSKILNSGIKVHIPRIKKGLDR